MPIRASRTVSDHVIPPNSAVRGFGPPVWTRRNYSPVSRVRCNLRLGGSGCHFPGGLKSAQLAHKSTIHRFRGPRIIAAELEYEPLFDRELPHAASGDLTYRSLAGSTPARGIRYARASSLWSTSMQRCPIQKYSVLQCPQWHRPQPQATTPARQFLGTVCLPRTTSDLSPGISCASPKLLPWGLQQ